MITAGCAGGSHSSVPARGVSGTSVRRAATVGTPAKTPKLRVQLNKRGDMRVEQLGVVIALIRMPRISVPAPKHHPAARVHASGKLSVDVAPQRTKITKHHTFGIRRKRNGTLVWFASIRPIQAKIKAPSGGPKMQTAAVARGVR